LNSVLRVPLSVDTRKPEVAAAALEAGAALVNDVEANRTAPEMWQVVARENAGYVAMHMQGTPQTMQTAPFYSDVVGEVGRFLEERLERLGAAGVGREQVILDPGIGFGKSLNHNLDLIAHLSQLGRLQRPILLGVSRKSFLGRLLGAEVPDRLPGALACTAWAALQGVQVFRTHDVGATVQALRTVEALASARTRTA
jgi:dihydropteroate synthase